MEAIEHHHALLATSVTLKMVLSNCEDRTTLMPSGDKATPLIENRNCQDSNLIAVHLLKKVQAVI